MNTKTTSLSRVHLLQFMLLIFMILSSCSYTLKIKDGRTAFDRKRYDQAIPMLQAEFSRAKTRSEKGQTAFLLAESFRRKGQFEKSLDWYHTAYENNYGADALKAWAYTLKKLERYTEAREAFKNLGIEIGSPYEYRKELTACTVAEDWLKQAPQSGVTTTPAPFNSPQNDFSPILFTDGRLVFTSDRAMGDGESVYAWTGNKFMDLYIVEPDDASPQHFDNQLNSAANEGTACFSKEGLEVFFVRTVEAYKGDDAYCKIYVAEKNPDGGWGSPTPFPYQKEKINYLHPALSSDGNTLFFSCNDPDGWGGYDLYSTVRNKKSETGWDEPKLMSRNINSSGNELFPTIVADTLFFASDGLQGMGGLDIFSTFKADRNAWTPPHNLKAPINSGSDDFGFMIQPAKTGEEIKKPTKPGDLIRTGFFSSNRPGGRGGDDIYHFEQRVPPPKPVVVDTLPKGPITYKIVLEGYVLEKIFANQDDPNSKFLGRKPLKGATVVVESGSKKQNFIVKEDGYFKLELAENSDYYFTASLQGYLSNNAKFSTKGIAKDPATPTQVFEIEIVLDKIFKNREIVLENIYYDYDKWDIRPDAEPTLNRLADVLRQNPSIRIQLGSHTDCRGNDTYNQELSQRRAQSAVNYLIGKGINEDRLSAIGYGESQPAATCACTRCSEAEHQTNRRTTFKIVE
jgi:peptidoglycan-associated lipoprotein